jgi:hypothetical protein
MAARFVGGEPPPLRAPTLRFVPERTAVVKMGARAKPARALFAASTSDA